MYLKPTEQLSKEATEELLEELFAPNVTPEIRAQAARVKALTARRESKSRRHELAP